MFWGAATPRREQRFDMGQFLYTVLGFTFLLTFILGLYGASANIPDITGPMNVLVGPWPTISVGKCDRVTFCLNQIADFMGSIGAIIFVGFHKPEPRGLTTTSRPTG